MKSQLTSTKKQAITIHDVLLVLIACLGFIIVFTLYSAEVIDIVQQIEVPSSNQDELLTAAPSI